MARRQIVFLLVKISSHQTRMFVLMYSMALSSFIDRASCDTMSRVILSDAWYICKYATYDPAGGRGFEQAEQVEESQPSRATQAESPKQSE